MTLDLDIKSLSIIIAGLHQLERAWTEQKQRATSDDEIADLTNDLLFARSLRAALEQKATEQR